MVKIPPRTDGNYFEMYKRVLIPNPQERFQYIVDWVNRNVKDIPYTVTRRLKQLESYKENTYGIYKINTN